MTKTIEIGYQPKSNARTMFDYLEGETLKQLEANNLNPETLLFRGIYPSKLEQVLKTGTDRNKTPPALAKAEKPDYEPEKFIYAGEMKYDHSSWDLREVITLAWARRKQNKISLLLHQMDEFVMLCYNKSMLEKVGSIGEEWPLYKIKEGCSFKDALNAVIIYKPEKVEK